jgi:hypothetical protein
VPSATMGVTSYCYRCECFYNNNNKEAHGRTSSRIQGLEAFYSGNCLFRKINSVLKSEFVGLVDSIPPIYSKVISASSDGGPRSKVCTLETLRSAPIDASRNFTAHMSAESPSNISTNPSEVISKVSEP